MNLNFEHYHNVENSAGLFGNNNSAKESQNGTVVLGTIAQNMYRDFVTLLTEPADTVR